ncbi:MAG: hypothetical protein KGD60_14515 [Candidatus Thorarchaeota archaeon]|nr:hypothetical protein [Candidatus Thorarchaeota archaeon]
MDRPVMFNGRLNKDEVDTWLNLLNDTSESSYKDRNLAKAFLMLQESLTFVSSLENKTIGGTSIFKDKTRLAMVLTSVVVDKEFRESAAYQIIKSSLPFFKTVAIRDVDALVSLDGSMNPLGFPLSLELDPWVLKIIKRIGFEEVGILEHCSFEMDEEIRENPINWNKEVNVEEIRELIWDQSEPMGLTNSLVWLARDFAISSNCLATATVGGKTAAVAGFWRLADSFCISPLVTDPVKLGWDLVAESLIAEAVQRDVKRIDLPVIGQGQQDLIRALENRCSRFSCRKLSLLRKPL